MMVILQKKFHRLDEITLILRDTLEKRSFIESKRLNFSR